MSEIDGVTARVNECPFCGECEDISFMRTGDMGLYVAICCENCGAEGPCIFAGESVSDKVGNAALLWNGRARNQNQTEIKVNENEV